MLTPISTSQDVCLCVWRSSWVSSWIKFFISSLCISCLGPPSAYKSDRDLRTSLRASHFLPIIVHPSSRAGRPLSAAALAAAFEENSWFYEMIMCTKISTTFWEWMSVSRVVTFSESGRGFFDFCAHYYLIKLQISFKSSPLQKVVLLLL